MWLQTAWAVSPNHTDGAVLFTKYAILCLILTKLLRTEHDIEFFAWMHVIGCFIWGWTAYTSNFGGRLEIVLGPGVDDSNLLGGHLVTGVAFAGFLFLGSTGLRRWVALGVLPFILNGIIMTASRSALVALVMAGAASLVIGPRGKRLAITVCGVLGCVLFLNLAQSDLFWERAGTLLESDQEKMDESAASRFVIAEANWRMFLDHPFGLGHRGNEEISPEYLPSEVLTDTGVGRRVRSAHNTVMAILADHGIVGILITAALGLWVLKALWDLRPVNGPAPGKIGHLRAAVGTSFVALATSGMFVNLLKAEVLIWLLALLAGLQALSTNVRTSGLRVNSTPSPRNQQLRPLAGAAPTGRQARS